MHVVLELFGERIGEATHLHPHGQVLTLDAGSADGLRIRAALDRPLAGSDALGRAVALSLAGALPYSFTSWA